MSTLKKNSYILLVLMFGVYGHKSYGIERIVSLAPHTTELIYALGAGKKLVAVSDYSNFPAEAEKLPSVANYNGVDIEAIMHLKPDLIVAWQGGNKPQDLARLSSLGFTVYLSSPLSPTDISSDIIELGKILGQVPQSIELAKRFTAALNTIKQRYINQAKTKVFYYLWTAPLMTIGAETWANKLIEICGATQIFNDSPVPYPEVSKEQVISRQPSLLIAAMKLNESQAQEYWKPTESLMKARVLVVDPDKLHRFTPRLISGLNSLCTQINGF